MPYEKFCRFYDLVTGDRSKAANFTRSLIAQRKPDAKTLLEIACGTGAILGYLADSYEVSGLDSSQHMLALARKKLPHVRFYNQDMTKFRIAKRFDAIVCAFDSINHVLTLAGWKKAFRQAASHLKADGLFVFDVNTFGKLQRLANGLPWSREFGRDLVVITVGNGQRGIFPWDVKVFEHQQKNHYRFLHETIREIAPPYKRIVASLQPLFKQIKVIDPSSPRPSDQSERLYFVCKR